MGVTCPLRLPHECHMSSQTATRMSHVRSDCHTNVACPLRLLHECRMPTPTATRMSHVPSDFHTSVACPRRLPHECRMFTHIAIQVSHAVRVAFITETASHIAKVFAKLPYTSDPCPLERLHKHCRLFTRTAFTNVASSFEPLHKCRLFSGTASIILSLSTDSLYIAFMDCYLIYCCTF